MHIFKLSISIILLFNIATPSILYANPQFECNGYSTIIYKNNEVAVAVCHSLHMKVKRSLLSQWQDCTDAMIFIRNIKTHSSQIHTDCTPITHKQFKINKNTLSIKHYYNEFPGFELKPLLVEKYNIIEKTKKHTLIVKLPKYTKNEVLEAISKIDKEVLKPFNGNTYFDNVYNGFFMLRAYAHIDPKFALNKLKEYEKSNLFSGEVSEVLSDVVVEAELISFSKNDK